MEGPPECPAAGPDVHALDLDVTLDPEPRSLQYGWGPHLPERSLAAQADLRTLDPLYLGPDLLKRGHVLELTSASVWQIQGTIGQRRVGLERVGSTGGVGRQFLRSDSGQLEFRHFHAMLDNVCVGIDRNGLIFGQSGSLRPSLC